MDTNFSSDRVIVKLKPGANSNEISNLQAQIGVTKVSTASQLGIDIWQIPSGTVEKTISAYKNDPRFEYIEPDYIITLEDVEKPSSATESSEKITPQATTPNDPGYSQLWGLNNIGQSGGTADADIDAPEAWDIQRGNPNLVIGVIDSGVDYNHPDLVGNIWTNPGEIAGDGIDNDSNGYIDDVRGWDFAYNDNNPMDVDGHGTHVAGTIAGKGNNGVGVTGVAWNAKIMPLKFLDDSGSGYTSSAILAINYATAKGVKLTNNSWGGGGYSQALYDAINTAGQQGALFIAAAGNDGTNNDIYPAYPASYNLANIISVASTTRTDGLSWFSNYGATTVDLGAPGSDIYSTLPNSSYGTLSGTSMASPHVTGAAALLWSQNPTWTAQQVKDRLMQTTDPISALSGKTVTGGRLNINNALAGFTPPPSTNIAATDTGWYDNSGSHSPTNTNYIVGDYWGSKYRNWMTFNLSTFTTPVTSAKLQINAYEYSSADPSETYELRDVTTPVSTLTAGGSGLTSIYNDLGDGTIYGSRSFTSADSNQTVTIDLNSALVSAINAKSGQSFALGGQITTLDGIDNSEYIFGFSNSLSPNTDVQLLLTYGPTDTTPPTASSFSPVDNATGVAVAADLVANFSEAIQKGTGDIVIKKLSDNSVVETIAVTNSNVTVSDSQLTINPTNDLAQTTDYYVEIANGAIKDIAGNNYAGITGNSTWNFQTADTTAPTASSFTPTDDATNIAVGADLVANFSEAIQKGTGDIVIKKLSDNSVVETIAVTNSNVTVSDSQLTINPTNDLAQTTDYYVEIANGAIKDIAGNNYAGITGNSTWNFQTADTTAPTASSFTPTDDATNIAVGADLVANFSEAIQKGTGDIVIKKLSDNSVVETIAVTNSNVTVSDSQLTINPTNDLAQTTDYYVEIANGAIKDIAGNNYAGITGNSTWNFQTADTTAPTASSFTPTDDATNIAVGADLVANFSEAIQKGTGDIVIKKLSDNSVVETIAVTNSNVTVSDSQLTINPTNDLAQTTDYYVEIANGAIKDIAGNNYAGITGNSTWNFQTADTTAPTASSFTPTDDATNIAVGADLVANFSEAIQKGTGDIVIKKLSDNSVVETIAVTNSNVTVSDSQLTINPTNDLAQTTDYYVEIANGAIKDIAGNNYAGITGNSTWNFKTVAPAAINGTPGADNLTGTANADVINGLAGNDTLNGLAGNDTLDGGTENDRLDGGLGNDQLKGGLGNDIYIVDSTGDVVTELAAQGTDLVQSSVTYTLPANVENLTLTGTTAINGTGNTLANIITGNTANNILNGSSGADQLKGGTGNDTYVVDNTGDVVTELASQGTDLIQSSVTYTLPANVENLTLTGTTAINGTGNTLANIITGNTANNILNGSSGADQLKGGTGNDTYVVDNTGDVVTELASQGTDLIQSSVTYTLPANVENLTLTGTTAINGTGNTLANTVTGNTANNILNGGTGNDNLIGGSGTDQLLGSDGNDSLSGDAGNDTLTGGLGADKFIYNTNAAFTTTAVGVDTITDFNISQTDQIVLDKTTFTSISSAAGTGFSVASEFAKVTTDALAATRAADIVYNSTTGGLFYNQNGTAPGFGTGGKFLTLTNKPALTATQFLIQA